MYKKLLALLLCTVMLFGQVQAAAPEQGEPAQPDDHLAQMEAEREISELPIYDRFIVKLKSDSDGAMRRSASLDEGISTSVDTAIPAAKSAANTQVEAVLEQNNLETTAQYNMADTPTFTAEEHVPGQVSVFLSEKVDAATFVDAVSGDPQVEYVQPDYALELASDLTLDIDLSELENPVIPTAAPTLEPTPAPEIEVEISPETSATPATTTPPAAVTPIVAVLDGGIDVTHPGLSGRLQDGYDFVKNAELSYDNTKKDEYYHGTHVAGIIAQNAPDAKLMPLKVFERGRAYTSDIVRAIEYAQQHGANIVNMSFGGKDDNRALREAMAAGDVLFICAAGNARADVDAAPVYPASFELENVISIASLNQDLGFSYYSNYGTTSVDIAAVGREVNSLWPENQTGAMSGTSMAAAQVSAGAAVAAGLGRADVKAAVLESADKFSHLGNKVAGGRSLSVENLVEGVQSDEVKVVDYADNFDVHGYAPTPEESWGLYSASETVDVAAGSGTSYALKADGTVWAWGDNSYFGLGESASISYRTYPAQVPGLTDIVQISASSNHCYALKSDGTVMAWGKNDYGMLGADVGVASLPRVLQTGAKYVAAGDTNSVVVKTDGTVTLYGDVQYFPDVDVSSITGIDKAAVDWGQFALLKTDGTVLSWGRLIWEGPDGGGVNRNKIPYIQPGLTNVKQVSIEFYETYMVTGDGKLYLGGEYNTAPRVVDQNIKSVATNGEQVFKMYLDGTATGYGNNYYHQLGAGADVSTNFGGPYPVIGVPVIARISAASNHTIALCENGTVWTWGDNSKGQLGTGDTAERVVPVQAGIGDSRDGSTYQNAYILSENSAVAPSVMTQENWFEFTPSETGKYIISSYGSTGITIDGYFYETDTPTDSNYSQSSYTGYARTHFQLITYLTKNKRYYIRTDDAPQGKGYGVRVENADRAMLVDRSRVVTMEAEDMVRTRFSQNNITAEYTMTVDSGASGGKALLASGTYPGDNKINDMANVYMPPLSFTLESTEQKYYYFWVRSKVTDASQDSLWFSAGQLDGYQFANKGLNIGTLDQPWTWTRVAERALVGGYHTIALCPRELGGLIDKVLITDDVAYVPDNLPESEYLVYEMENGNKATYSSNGVSASYVTAEDAFASGASSVTATVTGVSDKVDPASTAVDPAMSFTVPINQEDEYGIWVRARKISDSSDSAWIAVDQEAYTYANLSHAGENTWEWSRLKLGTMTVGEHTIKLVPREAGGIYDKLVVIRGTNVPDDAMVNGHTVLEMEQTVVTPYTDFNGITASFNEVDDDLASGGKALVANVISYPDNRMDEVNANSQPVISYSFYADKADVYEVYFRALITADHQNSIWVGVDDKPYMWQDLQVNKKNENKYQMVNAGSFTLSPGRHTIKIIPRESGGKFDKLIVTNNRKFGAMENYMVSGTFAAQADLGVLTPFNDGTNFATYLRTRTNQASNGIAMRAKVVSPVWGGKIDHTDGISTPVLRFDTAIDKTGEYAVWARVCADSTASDSLWLKNDKGSYIQRGLTANTSENAGKFTWTKLDVVKLSAGSYTLSLIPRENDCLIDKIMLTDNLSYTPPELGLPQNPSTVGTVSAKVTLAAGEEKLVVLSCRNVRYEQFGNFVFNYNSSDLEIVDLAAQMQDQTVTAAGTYGTLYVVSAEPGSVSLRPAIIPDQGMVWSGTVTVVKVRGLRDCESQITFGR